MKTNEEILDYVKQRVGKYTFHFKEERKKAARWKKDNPFHTEHYNEMLRHSRKLSELKGLIEFMTGDDTIFYEIYNSID